MNTAQQNFRLAFGVVRKNAAYIIDRSADYYGQTDDEAFEYRAVKCVAKSINTPTNNPMPDAEYRAAVAAASVMLSLLVRPAALTPQEKLDKSREESEVDFD